MTTPREVFELDATAVGDQLRVTIAPGAPGAPALYVLDPSLLFDLVVAIARLLHTAARVGGGAFPHLTVVGVGYPTDDPSQVFPLRARDLTPTPGAATTAFPLPALPFGGAPRFLAALAEEVVPRVEARVDTDPKQRALAGFSFGGLFALYTLFHRPELFAGYLVSSPSLWWDDGLVFAWEEAWASTHTDLAARVLLAAGANEQTVGDTWQNEGFPLAVVQRLAQVDNLRRLGERLRGRGYPNLHLEVAVFADEYHLTVPPATFGRGLLTLFPEPAVDASAPAGAPSSPDP